MPENHVPMVRHQTVRKQSNWKAVHRRDHDSFKRDVIFRFGKQFVSSVRPIKGMIRDPAHPKVEPMEKILPAKTFPLSAEDTKNYSKYEKLWNEIFQLR
jgi:hypothetical protein